ncbi:serine/threonine-protein kinase RHS3-like [Zingiber officinale]|uniref:non-specific serine/threonine protein kinase n=1 Tax=Zingiber officinale TaxID=94328 RepID=A0A8J5F862_ZINOF|nr:serine/threonine-protein kinase RHS3-like [Zingiber officinale]KAG6481288.1 hypothetical protein ZIOFF_057884 [Zingiber officinale]
MKTNATSQEPTSFDDKRIDPRNNSGTGNGGGASKPSRNKKKTEPIFKSGTGTADAASKAACPSPKQQHANNGSRLPMISESASTSTCGNSTTTSATTTMTAGAAKSSDAKLSDSISRGSNNSNRSDSIDSVASAPIRRHTGGDCRWEAIQLVNAKESPIGIGHFVLLKRLGYGDIGSVYLVELRGIGTFFAMKVMDKASIASRNKLLRAQTEREILIMLDHPFLPTLYSHFETEKFYCLVMEYCSGGNLHSLRQKQPNKHFTEQAARFYASEVLLALEYLHMLGIVYRDLKPENVLVREEGHIMLSDFDLSLRCSVDPTLVKSSSRSSSSEVVNAGMIDGDQTVQSCIQPSSFFPRILPKKNRKSKSDFGIGSSSSSNNNNNHGIAELEFMAEPTNARSMSFVGTHEYLAPEIIRGEGHGSAVDWWTFGIFLYELLHGTTPFKGSGNKATLQNVVSQPLRFPETPLASLVARDLIQGLLVKDPQRRIAYHRGATEIKQHPFFEGINWALVRSIAPPHVPDPVNFSQFGSKEKKKSAEGGLAGGNSGNKAHSSDSSNLDFEYF